VAVNGALTVGSIGGISQINGGSTVASTYLSSNFYVAIGSQNNLLYGERDVAIGLRNSITGRRWNYIYGNDNVIRGLFGGSGNAYNFIFGNNSTIGDSNIPAVFRAEYSYLIGFSNSVITTTSNASNNVIIGRASSVQNVSFNILIGNVVSSAFNYVTILTSGPGDVVGQYRTATEDNELSLSAGGKLKFHAAAVQNAATIFTTGNFVINSISDNGIAKLQTPSLSVQTIYSYSIGGDITFNNRALFSNVAGPGGIGTINFTSGTSITMNTGGPQQSYYKIALDSLLQTSNVNATSYGIYDNVQINVTGTGVGNYTSFLANPTLTALTATSIYKAFQWTNNTQWGLYGSGTADNYLAGKLLIGTATAGASKVRISGLPTSSAGLVSGELWNNAGVVNIIP
jgi:hypothetical protein